jgi:hypothetical protein
MNETAMVPRKSDRPPADMPLVDQELADQLLAKAQAGGVELLGPDGLLSQVTKAVLERALAEEMTEHLGYEKHDPAGRGSGNSRNGTTGKTLLSDIGGIELEVPRDRNGSFDPQRRLHGASGRDPRGGEPRRRSMRSGSVRARPGALPPRGRCSRPGGRAVGRDLQVVCLRERGRMLESGVAAAAGGIELQAVDDGKQCGRVVVVGDVFAGGDVAS